MDIAAVDATRDRAVHVAVVAIIVTAASTAAHAAAAAATVAVPFLWRKPADSAVQRASRGLRRRQPNQNRG